MSLFVPNPNFAEEFESDAREGLVASAEAAKPLVEAATRAAGAPWMPRSGHDLIEVQEDEDGVYLVNTDFAAHLQEWGSIRNSPLAPLRRGVSAAGLRIEESPKP